MEYYTGDLRSAWYNGSDVKTIIRTNATLVNWDINIDGDFIYYTRNNTIMKMNKSLRQNPTVVHTDTHKIYNFLLYKHDGKNTSITYSLNYNFTSMLLKSTSMFRLSV